MYILSYFIQYYNIFCGVLLDLSQNIPTSSKSLSDSTTVVLSTTTTSAGLESSLLSTHADRQGVDISVTVCLFLCFCKATDYSAADKANCTIIRLRPRH